MPFLYCFKIQNLFYYPNDRNIGIFSNVIQEDLEELNEGDTTRFFNDLDRNDIVKHKLVVPFSIDNFDKIINNFKKCSKITVEKENKDLWCVINNEKYYIGKCPEQDDCMTFNYIGIYK